MEFEVLNFDAVFDRLERTARRSADLQESAPEIDRAFAAIEAGHFASQGRGRWSPLKRSTVEQKRRLGFPSDPLVRTGRMRDALTRPGAAGREFSVSEDELSWSFDGPAALHQRGTRNMQARKVVDLTDSDAERLFAPVVRRAEEVARAEGLR